MKSEFYFTPKTILWLIFGVIFRKSFRRTTSIPFDQQAATLDFFGLLGENCIEGGREIGDGSEAIKKKI